jgi:hypothetical protein
MLNEILIQLVFGFPAGIISLLLSALGILKKWPLVLIIAGIWGFFATYYISAASRMPLYLIGLFQFGSAYAVQKRNTSIAWLLLIPLFLSTLFLTTMTMSSLFESRSPHALIR